LIELGFTATRMCCLRGDRCAGLLMFHARVGPLQLRSSSECRRDSPNASLMLRTSGCISYTLKVACLLNVRGVLQQSRPEIRRSLPRLRSHGGLHSSFFESLHTQHSGTDHQSVGRLSSLPLQSDPYASTSPCALRAPQRALNALSSTQMLSSSTLDPARFLAQSPSPPHQAQ
jgi:hypothetical protein